MTGSESLDPSSFERVRRQEGSGVERRKVATEKVGPDMKSLTDRERQTVVYAKTVDQHLYGREGLLATLEDADLSAELEHLEELDALQTMAYDKIQKQEKLGEEDEDESGYSTTSRVEFLSSRGEKIVGYMKPARGEARFDKEGYPMIMNPVMKEWVRRPGVEDLEEDEESQKVRRMIGGLIKTWKSEKYMETYARGLQQKYGIPEDEYDAFKKRTAEGVGGIRLGIEVGSGVIREKAAYDLTKQLGFTIIPPTTLRLETETYVERGQRKERVLGIASVQESVHSKETKRPGREISSEDLWTMLMEELSAWPEALEISQEQLAVVEESLAEAACFHWMSGTLDCHPDNMLLTDEGFKFIDNANMFSKKRGVTIPNDRTEVMQKLRSVPMEILTVRPDLELSPEKMDKLHVYYNTLMFEGNEKRALRLTFLAMEQDPRIAEKEMEEYIQKLGVIAATGRPPAEAFSDEQLYPVGLESIRHGTMKSRLELKEKRRKHEFGERLELMKDVNADFDHLLEEQEIQDALVEIKEPPKPSRRPPPPPPARSARPLAE